MLTCIGLHTSNMAASDHISNFFIEIKRAVVGETLPLEDILDDLQLDHTLSKSKRDAINKKRTYSKRLKHLLRLLEDKPLCAYKAFSASIRQHAPDLYTRKLKPIEDKYIPGEPLKVHVLI